MNADNDTRFNRERGSNLNIISDIIWTLKSKYYPCDKFVTSSLVQVVGDSISGGTSVPHEMQITRSRKEVMIATLIFFILLWRWRKSGWLILLANLKNKSFRWRHTLDDLLDILQFTKRLFELYHVFKAFKSLNLQFYIFVIISCK